MVEQIRKRDFLDSRCSLAPTRPGDHTPIIGTNEMNIGDVLGKALELPLDP